VRILHVVPTYMPATRYGGPIRSVHALCRALVDRGHDVSVFTTDVDGPQNLDVPKDRPVDRDGVAVSYFHSGIGRRLYWAPGMKRAAQAGLAQFDILHLHSVFLWPTNMAARVACRKKVPYIVAPRGMLVGSLIERKSRIPKTVWLNLFEKRTLRKAAAIHVTSIEEKKEIERFGWEIPKIFVLPNGVDATRVEERACADTMEAIGWARAYVLFVGRLNWKKGLDRLVAAMSWAEGLDLIIAGNDEEGYRKELERLAERGNVQNRIKYMDEVTAGERDCLMANAIALVLPSYSENFGNVVLEAMRVGCPVVVTKEVGTAELVRESGAGLVVSGDPGDIGREITRLAGDEVGRKRMGESGRRAAELYAWPKIAEEMEREYQRILDDRLT
jgi:glycosyltransferase involved in cell wall biosynthesis